MARQKPSARTAPDQAFFRRLEGFDAACIRVLARIRIFETFLALGSAPPHLAELLSLVDGLRAGEARRSAVSSALTHPPALASVDSKGERRGRRGQPVMASGLRAEKRIRLKP